jgi:Flp pilus assembly protein TadD
MALAMAGTYAMPAIDDPLVVASGGVHALKLVPDLAVPAWLVWLELRETRWSRMALRVAAGVGVLLALATGAELWRCRSVTRLAGAGAAALDAGDAAGALASYEQVARLAPGLAVAQQRRAIALATLGRMDEALAGFARAVALAPDDPGTHDDYGRALAMRGRGDEAVRELEIALRLAPDDARVMFELARTQLARGRAADAVPLLVRARELVPEEPEITDLLRQAGGR